MTDEQYWKNVQTERGGLLEPLRNVRGDSDPLYNSLQQQEKPFKLPELSPETLAKLREIDYEIGMEESRLFYQNKKADREEAETAPADQSAEGKVG